jgi:3-oxoacyl-[acyl-carrier-protein] synthase II
MQRVVITGMGVVCPLGLNVTEFWSNLVAGVSGIGPITRFATDNYPVKLAAEVKNFDPTQYMDLKTVERNRRPVHFAIPAAKEAIAASGLDMSQEQPERVGIINSSMLENHYIAEEWERYRQRGSRRFDPLFYLKVGPSSVPMQLGMMLGARGPNMTANSLCASGTSIIATCLYFIRLGYADVMIAVAADASLDEVAIASMNAVGALTREPDPEKACRPFDLNRSGFVYGEGCGVLVLESLEHARKRGAPILAEVAGTGWSFDAYDATAPYPNTEAFAMNTAIKDGGLTPGDIDYINAHGTSTKLNDACETRAIKMALGDRAYQVPISSNKSMFGHMIVAAGAVESIGAILTMQHQVIPPTIHYETPDPDCDLDYVPNVAREAKIDICLKNSFGLGGQNCCLALKRSAD